MLKAIVLVTAILLGVTAAHAQETVASQPYDFASVGSTRANVPNCAPNQYVIVNGHNFGCQSLPSCTADQMVTTSGGKLVCKSVPTPAIPSCSATQTVTASNGKLVCQNLPAQVAVPNCTATQTVGVAGGKFVCRDAQTSETFASANKGCTRTGAQQICWGPYEPRKDIVHVKPFKDANYTIVALVQGEQDRFTTLVKKDKNSAYFYSYVSYNGDKKSGASGTYMAIGLWK